MLSLVVVAVLAMLAEPATVVNALTAMMLGKSDGRLHTPRGKNTVWL